MSTYDFRSLNDKEFERLCVDLLGQLEGVRFERFKPGKDKGVDGRFFDAHGGEVILQCKHWANTPVEQLIRRLKTDELPKVKQLVPARYIVAVSNTLSRSDKAAIHSAMSPFIKSSSDIFGNEDLNDLIASNGDIESRHYKLWLSSARVISHMLNKPIFDRSAFSVEEIVNSAKRYIPTANHDAAIDKLEKLSSVIITGEPGIGKTTLAEHICLHYVSKGFELFKIASDITEAEAVLSPDARQIFYFDDFLGRNYLEALSGHEGSHIAYFIRRIAKTKNKRFVLTSRSTILNQGKTLIDVFRNQNIDRNEFELNVTSLSLMDKARILYSHIWHSNLLSDYIDELYRDKRYREILIHRNFNPRLVSFLTDLDRMFDIPSTQYWGHVESVLDNPADIWEHAYSAQQDDFGRAIVLLVTLNGRPTTQNDLAEAFNRFVSRPQNAGMTGRKDFLTNLRQLTGSLLNRKISKDSPTSPFVDLFNPSIGDFLLNRIGADIPLLRVGFLSLRSRQSLRTLSDMRANGIIGVGVLTDVTKLILEEAVKLEFSGFDAEYIAAACENLLNDEAECSICSWLLQKAAVFVSEEEVTGFAVGAARLCAWALEREMISAHSAARFVRSACENNATPSELEELQGVISLIVNTIAIRLECESCLYAAALQYISENIDSEIDDSDVFNDVDYYDLDSARDNVRNIVCQKASKMGIAFKHLDIEDLISQYDVYEHRRKFFEPEDRGIPSHSTIAEPQSDEIDDLFDRT